MTSTGIDALSQFEVPRSFVEPAIRGLRLGNTLFDALFYDVGVLATQLLWRGFLVDADAGESKAGPVSSGDLNEIGLSALADPEGTILVVDANHPPYVTHRFDDVRKFIASCDSLGPPARIASVTGVGSSALGSVAFAWNLSTALGEPVIAIVPGYGVADVIEQALGGWLGFGLHGWLVKQTAQNVLARTAPHLATIGRGLMMTAPGHGEAANGAPVFERGSGSSDVLHAILKAVPGIKALYGHSKGALVIANAILGLDTTDRLQIMTFGCPVDEETPAAYWQVLGCFDGLGLLNSWGNLPEAVVPTRHTTNTWIPFSTHVSSLARAAYGEC